MSAEKIRTALGRIQDNPFDEGAWTEIEDAVLADAGAELVRELEVSRVGHERYQNWPVVARLLELEVVLDDEPSVAGAKQLELARVYHQELMREEDAVRTYEQARKLRPQDESIGVALGEIDFGRANRAMTVEQAAVEALDSDDNALRVPMLLRAAETLFRFGDSKQEDREALLSYLKQALEHEPSDPRGLHLATVIFAAVERWQDLADVLERQAETAETPDLKLAAAFQLALVARNKLEDGDLTVKSHQLLLDVEPASSTALPFLVHHYSSREEWEILVALYERQLEADAIDSGERLGVWVQLAMLNWRTLEDPDKAETYFRKVRGVEPANRGMLAFYREWCIAQEDEVLLMAILSDAQRVVDDEDMKAELGKEIAVLAASQENSRAAIDRYKTILRSDPDNADARDKLKVLYAATESYNALVELYRQDLQRVEPEDVAGRVAILKEIAAVYRDRVGSDTAQLTVLTQILQLDENDIEAVRALARVYESLGRWRDLLGAQQRLAELTDDSKERVDLLRVVARRWLENSNVQHAISSYEALLSVTGDDEEAGEKLVALYRKRRAWDKLFLLREKSLPNVGGSERIALMLEMAKLAAERLGKGAEAISLFRQVLTLSPDEPGVLDSLERQAERQKDYATVAEVLERRIAAATEDHAKLGLLQKLGILLADKVGDDEQAMAVWRRVLDLSPGHKRALRVLRQWFVEAANWDGLEELYSSQEDYDGLAEFLSTTADRTDDAAQKIDLSFRAARVYEERAEAPERASRSYERILSVDSDNLQAAQALVPLCEAEEKWSRLPELYEVMLRASDDEDAKVAILEKAASICGGPLGDQEAALRYARQAYDLRPSEAALKAMLVWAQQSGQWESLVHVVEERLADPELTDERGRELNGLLAEVYGADPDKVDDAVAVYRRLVEDDPADEVVARKFEALLRAANRADDLRWLLNLRLEQSEGAQRCEVLEEWALVEEEVFEEPGRAIELLARVTEEDPSRLDALQSLTRLLLEDERYGEAAQAMALQRPCLEEDSRVALELRLAELHLTHLDDASAALACANHVLERIAGHPQAVALLEKLMALEPSRAGAAQALEPLYAQAGLFADQAVALRVRLEAESDSAARLKLRDRLANLHEQELREPEAAFEVLLATLSETPSLRDVWDRLAELSVAAGRPTDLAEAYRRNLMPEGDAGLARAQQLDDELTIELCERAAILYEDRLGDPEGALPYSVRILDLEPRHQAGFERLTATLAFTENWSELEVRYQQAIAATDDVAEQTRLMMQLAKVTAELRRDEEVAANYYQQVLDLDPAHGGAFDALDASYTRGGRFAALAELIERRLPGLEDEEAHEAHHRLVDLYFRRLESPEPVVAHLESALRGHEDDLDVRALAEECLAVPVMRQSVAKLLDDAYVVVDDPRDLARVLDIRLEGEQSDDQRRDLLRRLAVIRDERLRDDVGAFIALCALLPLDPSDSQVMAQLLEVGERLDEHSRLTETLTESAAKVEAAEIKSKLLMEAARLAVHELDDRKRACSILRQVMALDPDDSALVVPAAEQLATLYQEDGLHAELAETLQRQAAAVSDVEVRRELHARVANLHEDFLEDDEAAVQAWLRRLDDDDGDRHALQALERLYERQEAWSSLVGVLRRLEEGAEEDDERRRYMVKTAEVLADELADTSGATVAWLDVIADFGPDVEALAAIAALHEKLAQWEELAEVYEQWLGMVDDGDERVRIFALIGDVKSQHLADPRGAMSAFRDVLTLDPSHAGARDGLAKMLEHEEVEIRREAAELIGPLFEAEGDAERLLKVLDIEIGSTSDLAARTVLLERALRTAEDTIGSADRAFEYALRGVSETLSEPSVSEWIATAERLAEDTERHEELLKLFESVVGDVLEPEVQQSLWIRAGEIARDHLADPERAAGHYRSVIDAQPDQGAALLALEGLYEDTGESAALLQILQHRAQLADDELMRSELLHRAAELQAGTLNEQDGAIATYEEIVEMSLESRAVQALEGLYRTSERYDDLVALYERQLDGALGSELADLRVRIARTCHESLGDTARALDELSEALESEPDYGPAIALLEALLGQLEDPDDRSHVAEMLEPAYLVSHDWTKLQGVLDARLAGTPIPSQRAELLSRLGTLYEEQLEDYDAALEMVAKRVFDQPTDEEAWEEAERIGRVLGEGHEARVAAVFAKALEEVSADDPQTTRLCARTAALYALAGSTEEALRWYRRAFEFDAESVDVFEAIDDLLSELERHQERIDHHRAAFDNSFDDERRIAHLHTVAELQRTLELVDDAVNTLCEVLDIAQRDERAFEELTAIYRRTERTTELAELYERRAELADDADSAAPHRLELAKLLRLEQGSEDSALDQLEAIVMDVPSHDGALEQLEEMLGASERKPRIVEILRPLYEAAGNWRGLIRLNEEQLALTDYPDDKVELLNNSASLWEDQGEDIRQAFEAVRQAFELAPDNEQTRGNLERLAEPLEAWQELADSYRRATDKVEDDFAKRPLLDGLASICDVRLDDPRRAWNALKELSDLDPSDEYTLNRLDTLSLLLAEWAGLVDVLERMVDNATEADVQATSLVRLGRLQNDMLDDAEAAINAYERALELQGESASIMDELIALHEGRNGERLVELLEQRVQIEGVDEAERRTLLLRAAAVYREELERPEDAVRVLRIAQDELPTDGAVLAQLEALYREQELYDELLENLRMQGDLAEESEQRVRMRNRIGDLYLSQFDNGFDALEQYRLVLEDDAANDHAIGAIIGIAGSHEDLRLDIAELLDNPLRAAGRFGDLVKVLEYRLDGQTEPAERSESLVAISQIQEEQLDEPVAARQTMMRALAETADNFALHDEAERLCELTDNFADYADWLEQQAADTYDESLQSELHQRLGQAAELHLEDRPRAIAAYLKASEQTPDGVDFLEALDRLYLAEEAWSELVDILRRRIEAQPEASDQAGLYHRLAGIQIDHQEEAAEGLKTLCYAADLEPSHQGIRQSLEALTEQEALFEEAADALEAIYQQADDAPARAELRNKRIGYTPGAQERVRLRLELAQMLEEESHDSVGAQQAIQQALADAPGNSELIEQLERLASNNAVGSDEGAAWRRAAEAVTAALEVEPEAADESELAPEVARDLELRVAGWHAEHLQDTVGAEKHFERALAHDPVSVEALLGLEGVQKASGRERDLLGTLRKLAALEAGAVPRSPSELRKEAHGLASGALADDALVEEILREMLEADDGDRWALAELSAVCERNEDHQELFSLLIRRLDLTDEADEVRAMRHQAASVAAEQLDEHEAAIGIYEQAFEDDAGDDVATGGLRRLYEQLKRHDDMLRLTERLTDLSEDKAERAALKLESAKICMDILEAPTEAIEHLNGVLDEMPGHEEAVSLLSEMLEKEDRAEELAELLARQIGVAREEGEEERELGFRLQQAELFETRLNEPQKAIASYKGVLDVNAKFRPALEALARLYEQAQQFDMAAVRYGELAEDAELEDLQRLVLKAHDLHMLAEDPEAATGILEAALEREALAGADRTTFRDGLRKLYRQREAWAELAGLFRREAQEADGDAERVVLLRQAATIHGEQRADHSAAAELLEEAVELLPGDRELMINLCDAYTASGRGAQAVEVLNRIVSSFEGRRSKELGDIHHRLAAAHEAEGDVDAALRELEAARKMDPGSVKVLLQLGILSLKMAADAGAEDEGDGEHLKRAGNAFKALLLQRLDANSPVSKAQVFYHLAQVSKLEGDSTKAKQMAQRAVRTDPDLTAAQDFLDGL